MIRQVSRKNITSSILLFLLSSLLLIVSVLYNKEKKSSRISESPSELFSDETDRISFCLKSTFLKINPFIELTDINGDTCTFNDLGLDSETIFFRFSEINCNSCVDVEFETIKQTDSWHFVLISSGNNIYGIARSLLSRDINFPLYSIEFKELNLPIEKINLPYYFTLNREYSTQRVFIPSKDNPELTTEFFKTIKRANNEN